MKKIFLFLVLFLLAFNVTAQGEGTDVKDDSSVDDRLEPAVIDSQPDNALIIPEPERKKVRERVENEEVKTENRKKIEGNRERLRALIEEKIKDTPAAERNRILKITERVENVDTFIEGLTPEEAKKFALLTRAKQIEIARERKAKKLNNIKIMEVKDEEFRVRQISKENVKKAVENLKEAIKQSDKIEENLKETRERLRNAEKNEEKLAAGKEHFTNAVEAQLTELNSIKERIQNNQDLTADETSAAVERIDNAISKLNETKARIEAATTLDELKQIGKKIREYALIKHIYKTRAVQANICHGILLRSDLLERKAELALSDAEKNGQDTTELNSKIEELSTLLETARTKCAEAKESFNSAKETDDVEARKELIKSFIESVKTAHETLRESNSIVLEIRTMTNDLNVELDSQKVDEIVVEEEDGNE